MVTVVLRSVDGLMIGEAPEHRSVHWDSSQPSDSGDLIGSRVNSRVTLLELEGR